MSNKGIFTALSGAVAQSQRLDTIANNIANSNTTSYKRDEQVFKEYLTTKEKLPDVIQVPRVPSSIDSFYDMQGGDKGYVDAKGTFTSFEQGSIKATGSPLDVAIQGDGFLEVLSPQGPRLTRNGILRVNQNGQLVTKEGFPVLREGVGQPPESRFITVQSSNLTISRSGDISEGGQQVAKLALVTVPEKDGLQKIGNSLYSLRENFGQGLVPATEAEIHQGFLEGSNVNIVKEMTEMISATRAFESTQKAIQAFDQMNAKLVNEIPRSN